MYRMQTEWSYCLWLLAIATNLAFVSRNTLEWWSKMVTNLSRSSLHALHLFASGIRSTINIIPHITFQAKIFRKNVCHNLNCTAQWNDTKSGKMANKISKLNLCNLFDQIYVHHFFTWSFISPLKTTYSYTKCSTCERSLHKSLPSRNFIHSISSVLACTIFAVAFPI